MSTNLHLVAKAEATLNLPNGKTSKTLTERFNLWQTPSKVTDAVVASGDPKSAYIEYIRSIEPDDTETMIEIEGEFGNEYYTEYELVKILKEEVTDYDDAPRVQIKTKRKEHEEELEEWFKDHEDWFKDHEDWKIEWNVW